MRRILFLFGSLCWLLFALGFGGFVVLYLAQGAGLQFFWFLPFTQSIVLGWIHVLGLSFAALICFVVSAGLWAYGAVPEPANKKSGDFARF